MSGTSKHNHSDRRDEERKLRDEELERLRRLVRSLSVCVGEKTVENVKKGRPVWELAMEQGPISLNLTDT